jgi:hypothetical protein
MGKERRKNTMTTFLIIGGGLLLAEMGFSIWYTYFL